MSAPESNYLDWVAKADSDLLNIENNLASRRVPWDTVCFHAQQVVEKMLKAFIVHRGGIPPRTHDLVALLALCLLYDPSVASLEEQCRILSYYAVSTRYPDDLADIGESEGLELVAACREIRAQMLDRLPIS